MVNPPRNLCDLPPLTTHRRAHTSPTLVNPFSPPKNATKSLTAGRGTRPDVHDVAFTTYGASAAVWGRPLPTASLGAAIAAVGDHHVSSVAPYLVLVDFSSWTCDALFPPTGTPSAYLYLCFIC
jgi:hypothetical protein